MKLPPYIYSILLAAAVLTVGGEAQAVTPSEVEAAVAAAKKAPRNRVAQREAGRALLDAGEYEEAITYFLKADNAGNLGAAEAAFYLYDFDRARTYLDRYEAKRTRAEREKDIASSGRTDEDGDPIDPVDELSSRITLGADMLGRVEQIEIIDSINIPADELTRFMRLAASAGTLADEESIRTVIGPKAVGADEYISAPGYLTEGLDRLLWTKSDDSDRTAIYETPQLADGSWGEAVKLFDYESIFDDNTGWWVGFPYLLSDGVTLYFAADGDRSLGGLDIYMTRRDEDGFLQPSNIGMPYNSPFNDYLYAIDDETGVGWWVSDRSQIPDTVTLYTFIPKEVRSNYSPDTPDLAALARASDIKSTQPQGADYSALRRAIARNAENRSRGTQASAAPEFELALPDGRVVTRLSDLRSNMSRSAMQEYLAEQKSFEALQTELATLREQYRSGDRSVSARILKLEDQLATARASLREQKNRVVTLEE